MPRPFDLTRVHRARRAVRVRHVAGPVGHTCRGNRLDCDGADSGAFPRCVVNGADRWSPRHWPREPGGCSARGYREGKTPGINLEAKRGEPAIWLVAHLDSKSQPIPILVRAAAIVACILVWIVLVVLSALRVEALAWHIATLAAALAGMTVAISTVGTKSRGALDNATGVAHRVAGRRARRPVRSARGPDHER